MAKTKLLLDASCDQCGTYIGKRRQKIHHENVFCNRKCQTEHQRIIRYCKQCGSQITSKSAKVFCGSSCAASFNNRGVRRHGEAPGECALCGQPKPTAAYKYCGAKCAAQAVTIYKTDEEKLERKRQLNRVSVAQYNAKKKTNTPEVSDEEKQLISDFYANCPKGYEVDHIYPISKGGWHVLSNLQYLPISENRRKQAKLVDNIAPWGYIDNTEAPLVK